MSWPSSETRKREPSGNAFRNASPVFSLTPLFIWLQVSTTSAAVPCLTVTHWSSPKRGDEKAGAVKIPERTLILYVPALTGRFSGESPNFPS